VASADLLRRAGRGLGEVLLTLGLVLALYTLYELYGTSVLTEQAQQAASARLQQTWTEPTTAPPATATATGDPIARIRIPAFGPAWSYTVLEGTDQTVLAHGPGHYIGTPGPGEPGNVAIAGHRVGRGAPFDGLGRLASCDPIIVETRSSWLTYRVLPFAGETATWAGTKGTTPACAGVVVPSGAYTGLTGREIVLPSQVDVIGTVPDHPGLAPDRAERLLTLTTCNPRFSDRQRLIIHAVLTAASPKTPGGTEP
jgi:sortase (surface protein transpeptidase)